MKGKYLVVIEKGEGNYSAYSPDLLGCVATGQTIEDTLREMRSAIAFHIEGILESGGVVPNAKSLSSYVLETNEISVDDILTSVEIEIPELALA